MQYAHEIMGLMSPFPGREFRTAGLVRYVTGGRVLDPRQRRAARKAVLRVMHALAGSGSVVVTPAAGRGEGAVYAWRQVEQPLAA